MKAIEDCGAHVRVELSRGQWALVDRDDALKVMQYRWYANPNPMGGYYAMASVAGRTVYMHRLIMDAPKGRVVDHRNHDTLDNRRENLRLCGQDGNCANRSGANSNNRSTGIRGVYVHTVSNVARTGNPKKYTTYSGRYMVKGRSKTKNFPFTDEGFQAAQAWVQEQRRLHMDG
jgi:hypothetical protein